jgi:ComF family protein
MGIDVLSSWRLAAMQMLFPPNCCLCDREFKDESESPFCPECLGSLLTPIQVVCVRCAMPCPEFEVPLRRCVHCRDRRLHFNAACTLGLYEGVLRQVVLKTKHAEYESLTHQVGHLLGQRLSTMRPAFDLVTSVPMHWFRRWWRGASAAEIIAKRVAADLRLPFYPDLLRCRRLLRRQSTLSTPERRRNVRRAYRTSRGFDISGANVLLIDDVLTSGATANETSRILRKAGAATITVAALARGTGEIA